MRIALRKLGVASLIAVCLSFGLSARSIADEMDGVVRYRFLDPDFRRRAAIEQVVAALRDAR